MEFVTVEIVKHYYSALAYSWTRVTVSEEWKSTQMLIYILDPTIDTGKTESLFAKVKHWIEKLFEVSVKFLIFIQIKRHVESCSQWQCSY